MEEKIKGTKRKGNVSDGQRKLAKIHRIIALSIGGIVLIAGAIWVAIVLDNSQKQATLEEAKAESEAIYKESESLSESFGVKLADLSKKHNFPSEAATEDDSERLFALCLNTFGYEDYSLGAPEPDAEEGTLDYYNDLIEAYKQMRDAYAYMNENVERCENDIKTVIAEINTRVAEEKAAKEAEAKKAAEEEAKKKAEAEAAAKRVMTYDKFTDQLYEGMTLTQLKAVWTGFDDYCKISTTSGGWVIYSCQIGSGSYVDILSLTFYYDKLQSKAQYGLD